MSEFSIGTTSLSQAMARVKSAPSDPVLRIGLFRLFSFTGQWGRALTQLETASQLDPSQAMYAGTYQACLACEGVRAATIGGDKSPVFLGEPAEWQALLLQALRTRDTVAKCEMMLQALEAAPATQGRLNGQAFEWISDADNRFGPQLEAFIDGKYYWIGFERLEAVKMLERSDLIDRIWQPAEFVFRGGGSKNGYIPVRYPGSSESDDPDVVRGNTTVFLDLGDALQTALGARQLATSELAINLGDVTELVFSASSQAP